MNCKATTSARNGRRATSQEIARCAAWRAAGTYPDRRLLRALDRRGPWSMPAGRRTVRRSRRPEACSGADAPPGLDPAGPNATPHAGSALELARIWAAGRRRAAPTSAALQWSTSRRRQSPARSTAGHDPPLARRGRHLGCKQDRTRSTWTRSRVDDVDLAVGQRLGGQRRRLERGRQLRADRGADDRVGALGEARLERLPERARGRRGGRREGRVGSQHPRPELLRGEVDPTRNSSTPKRTNSGTTRTPAAAAASGARSAVESVTIAVRPVDPSSLPRSTIIRPVGLKRDIDRATGQPPALVEQAGGAALELSS